MLIRLAIIVVSLGSFFLGQSSVPSLSTASSSPLGEQTPKKHNTGTGNLEAAWVDFAGIVGESNVSTDPADCLAHAGSEWSSHQPRGGSELDRPFLVLYPHTTDEVSRIMKVCHDRRIGVVAYSGGTSIEGNYAPMKGGICVDFSRMDRILALHKDDMDVVVQPGIGWEDLNDELAKDDLFFPPDPGPGAKIGGMVGTGCSGTNAYRYGTMREWVLSLTVVLADGTIVKTRQRARKSSAGYDLTKLFIGSEGTLGLVTEATLRLAPVPAATSVAVCSFTSLREAAECVAKVVRAGVPIAAIEVLDAQQMLAINTAGNTGRRWTQAPTLFFKFAGTEAGVKEQIAVVRSLAQRNGSLNFEFARNEAERVEIWSARKEALCSVMAMRQQPSDRVWTTDVAVPISRLPEMIEETQAHLARQGIFAGIVGHVGDGNFHAIIAYSEEQRARVKAVVKRMVKRAVEMEGTVTGEHGVGLVKRDYLEHELGRDTVDAMRKVSEV